MPSTDLQTLSAASDVSEHILTLVASCVEGWFPPGTPLDFDEFIDRLCNDYLNDAGWDIEDLATPAVRKILRHARAVRRDLA